VKLSLNAWLTTTTTKTFASTPLTATSNVGEEPVCICGPATNTHDSLNPITRNLGFAIFTGNHKNETSVVEIN
jgi:hypothetical protein